MKLTYKQMLDAERELSGLLQLKPAPTARLASQIARNARLIDAALKDFGVAKNTLLEPYSTNGRFDEDALDTETKDTVYAEYAELISTEVDVEVHPLKLSDIEAVEQSKPGFEISTATYYVLDWLFDLEG